MSSMRFRPFASFEETILGTDLRAAGVPLYGLLPPFFEDGPRRGTLAHTQQKDGRRKDVDQPNRSGSHRAPLQEAAGLTKKGA
jgi:hypothetical protein